jgi:hypothetical protein
MINVRASVSLAGAAYQSGGAGRTHAHRGLCARPLGTAVLQDVHEASTPLGWTPPRRSAVRRDLSAISLSPPAVPVSHRASGRRDTHRARTDVRERGAMAPSLFAQLIAVCRWKYGLQRCASPCRLRDDGVKRGALVKCTHTSTDQFQPTTGPDTLSVSHKE